jgi:cytochrome P450
MAYEGATGATRLSRIPDHVPPELVIDFNYFDPPGAEVDPHLAWKKLHDGPDIVYTPWNGGHWIATRADDVAAIMRDWENFSNREFTVPKRGPGNPMLMPNQLDGEKHRDIRGLVLEPLSPHSMRAMEPIIRRVMSERIKEIQPRGRCDFVEAFSDIPAILFLEYAGMPKDKVKEVKANADIVARSDSEDERREARLRSARYLSEILEDRRKNTGDDLMSMIIREEKAGRITPDESVSIAINIFHGGLETVASLLAFIANFLARSPEHRQQLIDNPSISQVAAEEFLRRFGILNLARIATKDTVYRDITIKADEQIMVALPLASLDDRKFPDPLKVDFSRDRMAHYNFGAGPHRCLGSNLARPEIRIFLEEWLKYIPDFSLDPDDKPVGKSGLAMTMTRVPLVWPSRN